jgi:hypothetical protein
LETDKGGQAMLGFCKILVHFFLSAAREGLGVGQSKISLTHLEKLAGFGSNKVWMFD